jgi:hypothetical protein
MGKDLKLKNTFLKLKLRAYYFTILMNVARGSIPSWKHVRLTGGPWKCWTNHLLQIIGFFIDRKRDTRFTPRTVLKSRAHIFVDILLKGWVRRTSIMYPWFWYGILILRRKGREDRNRYKHWWETAEDIKTVYATQWCCMVNSIRSRIYCTLIQNIWWLISHW